MHLSEAVFLSWATAASECPGGGWGDMCLAAALRKGYGGREAGRQREGKPCGWISVNARVYVTDGQTGRKEEPHSKRAGRSGQRKAME